MLKVSSTKFHPRWLIVVFVALLAPSAGTCYSQTRLDEMLREMEARTKEVDLEIQRTRIQQLQFDADMARLRAETNRMRAESEAQEAADRAQQAAARQEAIVKAAAERHEEEIDTLRNEIALADVRMKNNLYLVGLIALFIGFGVFVVKIKLQ